MKGSYDPGITVLADSVDPHHQKMLGPHNTFSKLKFMHSINGSQWTSN